VSEKYSKEILSLPMSEQLKEDEIKYVSEKIKDSIQTQCSVFNACPVRSLRLYRIEF
jgi:hypothetical protein